MYPAEKKRNKPQKKQALPANGLAALAVLLEDDEFTGKNKKGQKQKKNQNIRMSIQKMAEDMGIGVMTLSDIVEEIKKPAPKRRFR